VEEPAQRHLILIVARDFASRLATAVFLVDPEGNAIYFNEAAERLLGRPFVEGRGMPAAEWSTAFTPVGTDGEPLLPDELPLMIALARRVPAHRAFSIRGLDGASRDVGVTAFPLFAHTEEFVGAVAIFWDRTEED
jgi:PAS domain-containing protein